MKLFLVQSQIMPKFNHSSAVIFLFVILSVYSNFGFSPAFAVNPRHRSVSALRITGLTQHLSGDVILLRHQRQSKMGGETVLRAGDWVRTGKNGRVRLDFPLFKLDLPPYTTVSIDEVTSPGAGKFSLHYGHLRVTLKDLDKAAGNIEIDLPTAVMKAALGCDGEFLIHSMRTEAEFRKVLGGEVYLPPALKELGLLKSSEEFFGQVASIKCPVDVKPEQSDQVRLRAGDLLHIHARTSSFAPVDVGLTELKSVRNTLGFPTD